VKRVSRGGKVAELRSTERDLSAPIMPDLRELIDRPADIAREIHKGRGHQLRFGRGAGQDAFDYATGWSLAEYAAGEGRARPRVVARLYEALTDRRLSGARGFLPARLQGCCTCGEKRCTTLERIPRGLLDAGVDPSAVELAALASMLAKVRARGPTGAPAP
jgi:hypothetical protein